MVRPQGHPGDSGHAQHQDGSGLPLAAGKDVYQGEGHDFGLLDNKNTSYNFSVSVYPTDKVTVGGSYGYETYKSLLKSRNANPTNGSTEYDSWFDPNRTGTSTTTRRVKNLDLYVDCQGDAEYRRPLQL